MYASVTAAQINRERIDDVGPLYERLAPALREARGWIGIYVVIDRPTGDGHLLGLWETKEDAISFESSGTFQRVLSEYPPGLLVGPPQRTVGEVVFHASR